MTDMKVLLLIGLLLMSIRAQAKTVAPAFLIVPGQSIGKIKLGDSRDEVHKKMGKPQFTSTGKVAAYQKSSKPNPEESRKKVKERDVVIDEWQPPKAIPRLTALFYAGRVIQIQVALSGYATRQGLSVNSSLRQFSKRYKNPEIAILLIYYNERLNEPDFLQQSWDYVPHGLALFTDVYGFQGSDPEGVDTIIVHERNRSVFTGSSVLN